MVKLNRIYTRTGDDGHTQLTQKGRLIKSAPRIEAVGTVDELNCSLGVLIAHLNQHPIETQTSTHTLNGIQNDLFNLGAEIAMQITDPHPKSPCVQTSDVIKLEQDIDQMNAKLPELRSFILPQGDPCIAQAHMARSICRRCERRLVALNESEPLRATTLHYVNRLSDWLFVLARHIGHKHNIPEVTWKPNQGETDAPKT